MPPNTGKACNCEICNWPVGTHTCTLLDQSNQRIWQELEQQEALRLEQIELEQQETLRRRQQLQMEVLRLERERLDLLVQQQLEIQRRQQAQIEELRREWQRLQIIQRELLYNLLMLQVHEQMQHALDKVYDSANQQLQLIIQQKTLYENLCHHVHECSQLQKEKLEQIGSELNLLQQKLTLSEVPGFELFREIIHNLKQMNNIKNIEALERMLMEYYRDAQQRLNEKQMQQLKFLEELKHLKPKMDELREELCQTNGGTIS